MWARIREKAKELFKRWWVALVGLVGAIVLLLIGRTPKWQKAKVAEVKQRDKLIEEAKESAASTAKELKEARSAHDKAVKDAGEMASRTGFGDPDGAAEFIDSILRERK